LSLIFSQFVLLVFTSANLHLPDLSVLTLGAGSRDTASLANVGFLPLSVNAAARFVFRPGHRLCPDVFPVHN
jgi:hypothetical protein